MTNVSYSIDNLNMVGIYMIINNVNGKIYIGSTNKSFKLRFRTHINSLKKNRHENPLLLNAWNKYGDDCFTFKIIESFDEINSNLLLYLEMLYIEYYNSLDRNYGYNICNVGKSRYGTKWNKTSKEKRCGRGNPMFGKGELRKGKLNPMYGKTLTDLHKSKMSKSLTGIKKPMTSIKLSKPVLMLNMGGDVINEYLSCTQATELYKLSHISDVCNGKRKSAGGFKWKWK